ncbi:hypothetical protein EDB92DRAFT_1820174 [Lactarius akahatsu]|uniref:Uncharacterized protein n=1 Tax=Lactarius akahatsu TaxID=416441 RepID=A0AAD4L8P6_9AGAM|nr:hypothetical protein EDB92DRAFT_1820174 [Lactarius akahatsu]
MQATVSVLALYFALLHLKIHLVTIVETTSDSDHVDERYRVVAPKNHPNPPHVYTEVVVRLSASGLFYDVDSSGGRQGATTSSAGLEDDAGSTLLEHIELSKSRAPRDGEDSEEESEEETLDGVDMYSQKVRGTKDAMYHAFESIGNAKTATPPFLPGYRRGYSAPTDGVWTSYLKIGTTGIGTLAQRPGRVAHLHVWETGPQAEITTDPK